MSYLDYQLKAKSIVPMFKSQDIIISSVQKSISHDESYSIRGYNNNNQDINSALEEHSECEEYVK